MKIDIHQKIEEQLVQDLKKICQKRSQIQWDMMQILEHKCWRCQYWIENREGEEMNGWICQLQHFIGYSGKLYSYKFPKHVHWMRISSHHLCEKKVNKDYITFFHDLNTDIPITSLIDECPCFTESIEYHKWKEQHSISIQHSKISL